MLTAGNEFGKDANGDEILLSSRGQQVMMQWEKKYMEACVDSLAIQSSDRVLEIGFGLAYSATRIQQFRPKCHTIIECDTSVLQRARAFALNHHYNKEGQVVIEAGTWQSVLPSLGQFDCVFFDDYPLPELENETLPRESSSRRSRWHDFLDVVLHHVNPGARITGYLARQIDLQREGYIVMTSEIHVETSSSCNYYPHQEAYIPVITVADPALAIASRRHTIREAMERVRENLIEQDLDELHHDLSEQSQCVEKTGRSFVEDATTQLQPSIHHDPEQSSASTAYLGHASRSAFLAALRSRAQSSKESAIR